MAITSTQFRTDFAEFADTVAFPDAQLNFWLANAVLFLDQVRWGTWLPLASELFVAHHVAIEARAVQESGVGGIPGTTTGPIASKSVDKVSLSFDVGSVTEEKGGHWNLTIYGTRLYRMMLMLGAGPVHIGAVYGAIPMTGAYMGPWYVNPNPAM